MYRTAFLYIALFGVLFSSPLQAEPEGEGLSGFRSIPCGENVTETEILPGNSMGEATGLIPELEDSSKESYDKWMRELQLELESAQRFASFDATFRCEDNLYDRDKNPQQYPGRWRDKHCDAQSDCQLCEDGTNCEKQYNPNFNCHGSPVVFSEPVCEPADIWDVLALRHRGKLKSPLGREEFIVRCSLNCSKRIERHVACKPCVVTADCGATITD